MKNKIGLNEIVSVSKRGTRVEDALLRNALVNSGRLRTDFNNLYILSQDGNVIENIGVAGAKAVARIREELFEEDVCIQVDSKKIEAALNDIVAQPSMFVNTQDLKNNTLLNLENGIIDLVNLEFVEEREPKLLFDNKLRFSFKKQIGNLKDNAPIFARFCEESLGVVFGENGNVRENEKKLISLLQVMGYLLSNVGNLRKAAFFVGPPASGKSTILHVLGKVMSPKSTVTAYNFRQLTKTFTMASVANSKLNIIEEMDVVSKAQLEAFKLIVAGGNLTGERKYKEDVEVKASVKLAVASNSLPLFESGNLSPIVDRMHVVVFEKTVPRNQRELDLAERLWEEKDAIFSYTVMAFAEVIKNNGAFTLDERAEVLLNRMLEEANSEEQFIKAHLEISPGKNLTAKKVYEAYLAFCQRNALTAKSRHCLYTAIAFEFGKAGEKKKVRDPNAINNDSVQGFAGLRLKGGEDVD